MSGFLQVSTMLLLMTGWVHATDEFADAFVRRDWTRAEALVSSEAGSLRVVHLAGIKAMQGDFDAAHKLYETACIDLGHEPDVVGRLQVAQAIVAFLEGRQYGDGVPAEALTLLEKAKSLLGKDDLTLKMVETEIMGHSSKALHVQQAYVGYMQLLSIYQNLGDSLRVGHCAMRLGCIDGTTGGHGGALQNFVRAAHIFESLGQIQMHAWALRNMGHAHRKLGHYDRARHILKQALAKARMTGGGPLEIRILNDLSRLAMEAGDAEQALEYEVKADAMLSLLQEKIATGDRRDSVMLDFYQLLKLRYASLLPYETDLYMGFYDQLILVGK